MVLVPTTREGWLRAAFKAIVTLTDPEIRWLMKIQGFRHFRHGARILALGLPFTPTSDDLRHVWNALMLFIHGEEQHLWPAFAARYATRHNKNPDDPTAVTDDGVPDYEVERLEDGLLKQVS